MKLHTTRLLAALTIAGAACVGCSSSDDSTADQSGAAETTPVTAAPAPTDAPTETSAPEDTNAPAEAEEIPLGPLLGADVIAATDVSEAIGEEVTGACSNVETQQKCVFTPTGAASEVAELMVDCNSIFSFALPSPRMEEYVDTPIAVDGIGSAARFRTIPNPDGRSELELERASGPVTMCSVQLTYTGDATADPAAMKAPLTAIATKVNANLPT
jgi:hypothetical protein